MGLYPTLLSRIKERKNRRCTLPLFLLPSPTMFLRRIFSSLLLTGVLVAAILLTPPSWLPQALQPAYYSWFGESSYKAPPDSRKIDLGKVEPFCPDLHPDWRKRQEIEGITIEESLLCDPDNPWAVAAFVKGTNNVSMDTLMKAGLSPD